VRGYELATSSDKQQVIQALIDSATPNECQKLRSQAEEILGEIHARMGRKLLSYDENKAAELAIETLTRLDATTLRKGAWYRAKRRVQLTQMYLGV